MRPGECTICRPKSSFQPSPAPPAGLEPATHGLGISPDVSRCAQGDAKRLVRASRSRRESRPAHPISSPRRAIGWATSGSATHGVCDRASHAGSGSCPSKSDGQLRVRCSRIPERRTPRRLSHPPAYVRRDGGAPVRRRGDRAHRRASRRDGELHLVRDIRAVPTAAARRNGRAQRSDRSNTDSPMVSGTGSAGVGGESTMTQRDRCGCFPRSVPLMVWESSLA